MSITSRIAERFDVKPSNLHKTINRAIRTLPGGSKALDALEALNKARRAQERHRAYDRAYSTDAALCWVEEIVNAMELHVMHSIGEAEWVVGGRDT